MYSRNKITAQSALIMFILLICGTVYGQELPFDRSYEESYSYPELMSYGNYTLREVKISTNNVCYQTSLSGSGHTISGSYSESINLEFFGGDNEFHQRSLVTYNNWDGQPHYDDIYEDFVIYGNGIAFPKLTGNNFRWYYYDTDSELDTVSAVLTLPGSSFNIIRKCQMDNTHSLVLFQNTANTLVYAAYLDVNASILWDCSFNLNLLSNHNGNLSDVVMLDSSHFVLGFTNPSGVYELFTMNTLGEVTGSVEYNAGIVPLLNRTNVPGRLVLSTRSGSFIKCYVFESQVLTPVVSIPGNSASSKISVMADNTGIILVLAVPYGYLRLEKYSWDGALAWSDILSGAHFVEDNPRWVDISPSGNVVLGFRQQLWTPVGDMEPNWMWNDYYTIAKVISDGSTTGTEDSAVPLPTDKLDVYPNPFCDRLTLSFCLKTPQPVEVKIYNLKGQLVRELSTITGKAGKNEINWIGIDTQNHSVPDGMYLIKVQTGNTNYVRKCLKLNK